MKKPKITFTKSAIPFILKAFDHELDTEGFITDSKTKERILSPEGAFLTKENFGGIIKSKKDGSPVFLKKGLLSAIMICEGEY
jgi:ribosomal protein S19E (S16A)